MDRKNLLQLAVGVPLLLAFLWLGVASGSSFRLEADMYQQAGDMGGSPIHRVACGGAFNGYGVDGMDVPGDWISWTINVGERTCFVDSLRSQGATGYQRQFAIIYTPDPPATTATGDTTMTIPGDGIG